MEIGAVTVMLYCFRERELLLNINEMIAGFRMFPSYIRVGGLREDLPRGLPRGGQRIPRPDAGQARRVRGPAHEEPDLASSARAASARSRSTDALALGLVGPMARAAGVDLRRPQGVPVLRLRDVRLRRADRRRRRRVRPLPGADRGDAPERCGSAARRSSASTPTGVWTARRSARGAAAEGQGLHRDGSADSALPDLLAGVQRAGRRGLRAGRRAARRAWVLRGVGRHATGRGA